MRTPIIYIGALLLIAATMVAGCASPQEHSRMAELLAEADSMNRNYVDFTTDSVMRSVVHFYDRHGNANECMKAHYLLGCAYRDMGEAPQALACYQDAVDCADTTATDCDYLLLAKIHGQMGSLFQRQAIYRQAINEYLLVDYYGMKAKDTLVATLGYGQMASCYYDIGIIDSCLLVSQLTQKRLKELGRIKSANTFLSHPILVLLNQGKYQKAKKLLNEYEYNSTLSDQDTFLYKNYYRLYYYKGLFFSGTNNLDSASYCFRKMINEGATIDNKLLGYSGLLTLYIDKGNIDSIKKNAWLYMTAVDSTAKIIEQSRLQDIQGMYDYTRSQQIATIEARRAEGFKSILIITLLSSAGLILLVCLIALYIKTLNRVHLQHLTNEYVFGMMNYYHLKMELEEIDRQKKLSEGELYILHKEYDEINKEYELAKNLLISMQEDKKSPENWNVEDALLMSPIVKKFHKIASCASVVPENDWNELRKTSNQYMPNFMHTLQSFEYKMNAKETNLCILIRLRFIPSEECVLLEIKKNNLSNIRKRLLKKLFNTDGSAQDFDELIRNIPR